MRELTAWYQKKISSYDKEEWETMVEQLLMRGIYQRRVTDFSTKIRPYLIDVDLVRGSSFPKAKPTLGVWSVMWYGVTRAVFMPALYNWWKDQTSSFGAKLLLTLWSLQLTNILLFMFTPKDVQVDVYSVLIPGALMIGLSIVHAQIVSTTAQELTRSRPRGGSKQIRDSVIDYESGSDRDSKSKQPKFRRRLSLSRGKTSEDKIDEGLRKRKKSADTVVDNKTEKIDGIDVKRCSKAKDSDDEDYMEWKKRPTVTFTPPSKNSARDYNHDAEEKSELERTSIDREKLKLLEREVNSVRSKDQATKSTDLDDGFESLNGNLSNGSDNDNRNRTKTKPQFTEANSPKSVKIAKKVKTEADKSTTDPLDNLSEVSNTSARAFLKVEKESNGDKTLSEDWLEEQESLRSGASNKKRAGVRFRNSWVQEMIEQATTDDGNSEPIRKPKVKGERKKYNSSSSEEAEYETGSGPSIGHPSQHTMSDWVGQTTNSEECSYSSESEVSQSDGGYKNASALDPFTILNPASDTVKCTIWEHGSMLKAQLTAVDISYYVVARAEHAMANGGSYLWAGIFMAAAVALITPTATLIQVALEQDTREAEDIQSSTLLYLPHLIMHYSNGSAFEIFKTAFGGNNWALTINVVSCVLRFAMSGLCFFLLAVAERAFKQRFLYAKLFCHLTSARRARKSELPHFRLNTVRNIKTWLSARSYLRRRGPQRSVDVIVSAAFVMTLLLLAYVSAQLLRESVSLECGGLLEALVWCGCMGVWLLRLMTLGSNINRKYRGCLSALITEQINLHLAIEQRPQRKDQLTLANNVLKLAADLLKELDTPFKISGMCANHYLYTIFKVVILSAMSGVLSEMLGFKLKLYKIKIK